MGIEQPRAESCRGHGTGEGGRPAQFPFSLLQFLEARREVVLPDAYSIRQSLQGALQDFIRTSGFTDTRLEEVVRELVGMLASYREERFCTCGLFAP